MTSKKDARTTSAPGRALAALAAAALMGAAAGAQAQTYSGLIDTSAAKSPTNQSTDGSTYFGAPVFGPFPAPAVQVGEFDFAVGGGHVSSVVVSGNFGSDTLGSGTAAVDLFLNGVEVASCDAACVAGTQSADVAWSFTIPSSSFASFADGMAVLTAVQQDVSQIVLDPTSITVDVTAVPEPASLPMLLGALPLIALGLRRARNSVPRG
jgi:hypothetical protein